MLDNVERRFETDIYIHTYILSSTFFGYIRPSSGALDVELQHMVFLHRVFGLVVVLRATA